MESKELQELCQSVSTFVEEIISSPDLKTTLPTLEVVNKAIAIVQAKLDALHILAKLVAIVRTPLQASIKTLNLSVRTHNCLCNRFGDDFTVGELAGKTEDELLETNSFGETCLREVKNKLKELGLSLSTNDW